MAASVVGEDGLQVYGLLLWGPLLSGRTGSRCVGSRSCHTWAQQSWCPGSDAPWQVGISPDQGLNQGPLHCRADSEPLDHQGSPAGDF